MFRLESQLLSVYNSFISITRLIIIIIKKMRSMFISKSARRKLIKKFNDISVERAYILHWCLQ